MERKNPIDDYAKTMLYFYLVCIHVFCGFFGDTFFAVENDSSNGPSMRKMMIKMLMMMMIKNAQNTRSIGYGRPFYWPLKGEVFTHAV